MVQIKKTKTDFTIVVNFEINNIDTDFLSQILFFFHICLTLETHENRKKLTEHVMRRNIKQ